MKPDMMRHLSAIVISAVLLVSLDGCGGGNHSPIAGPGAAPVNAVTGVAATGAPIVGTVTLKDASTPAIELTTSTASDGTFLFNTANLKAPFILRSASGSNSYYSIATDGSGITNINPLTTIVVSIAAGGADLNAFYNAWYASNSANAVLNLPTADVAAQTALAPVLSQFGVSGSLLNSNYVADHTGADAMLDVIGISISSTGSITLTNKASVSVIFTAPATNIASGAMVVANIPAVPVQTLGETLYKTNCTKCHGDIFNSSIIGRSSVLQIMGAITSDFGGMSVMGALTPEELQAISDAIPAQATPTTPGTLSGSALYTNNCLACHGALASSTKLGVTIVRLQNAISNNAGSNVGSGMGRLSTLSAIDLNAIVVALNPTPTTPTTPTPTTTLDGATIYATNCSGCHGPLATSSKKGLTIARFYAAVTDPATGMGYLSSLSMAEMQAIISVMPPLPVDGAGLYAAKCSSCHGVLASSFKGGASVARINAGITNNPTQMGALGLGANDITLIAGALAAIAPPVTLDGPGLYAANCSNCHGALASSAKGGASVLRINTGITNNPGPMGGFATSLTAAQIDLIAGALAAVAPPPVALDGPGLYAANCAGCHGTLATSAKGGADTVRISAGITANTVQMGGFATSLTPAQITLIANALATVTPPPVALDGPGLYAANCAGCHNALASSTKGGATAARINAGITANTVQMGGLATSLTAAQINLIAGALAGIAPPVVALDGAGLYAANCAACHNPLATSTKRGPSMTVARIQAGIVANAGMAGFATNLTTAQITLISDALAALPAPVLTGPELYAANCAGCHNPLATSSKGSATAAKIQQEITNKRGATLVSGVLTGGMGAANLVALTPTQVGLIATALASIAPPACGSCHAVALASLTSGQHVFHGTSNKITGAMKTALSATTSCGICHGTGYTTTSNGNMLTHNNGIKNIVINAAANSTAIFGIKTWVAPKTTPTVTKGSCTPGCHGAKNW